MIFLRYSVKLRQKYQNYQQLLNIPVCFILKKEFLYCSLVLFLVETGYGTLGVFMHINL